MKRDSLMDLAQVSLEDFESNRLCIERGRAKPLGRPQTILWFLPLVPHALKGGVRTVFAFSEYMSVKHSTQFVFVVYSFTGRDFDLDPLSISLRVNFPNLRFTLRKFLRGVDSENDLPHSQIAFCTLWTTAYLLLRYNKTQRKYYFMQDFEPMFYAGGEIYMMIEQTYRLGFTCIANTPGVGNKYLEYSSDVTSFLPGVDRSVFYPDNIYMDAVSRPTVFNIVFYGRPENARNGFFLGLDILKALKRKMGSKVRIYSVGADWKPGDFGVDSVVENLGLLKSIDEVASLYRRSHLGLVFMATPHPSYQPLEYMASGCIVATNRNEANEWLLNESNALLLEPLSDVAAERIVQLLSDTPRRLSLVREGLNTVASLDWSEAYRVIESRVLR
ncbi:rhamnosyltransferase WsaF family glycosyltransferase [Pseudomonas sp. Marseille-QA0892]